MVAVERNDYADFEIFLKVARRNSFTAAAHELGLTPSAVSHAIRRLEDKLGAKLLNRTNRAISATELGARLASRLESGFEVIAQAVAELGVPGARRFGELRLNILRDAAHLIIAPALAPFAKECPDVRLTVVVEDRPIDIVEEGYDAGVRYGHHVPEDMVAVSLTGPQRWVIAASPTYLAKHGRPNDRSELAHHVGIQMRLGDNAVYRWELGADGQETKVRVPGFITINDTATTISAVKVGLGLGYFLESRISAEIGSGDLEIVLPGEAAKGDPLYMYYSNRRHNHPALRSLMNIIRQQNGLPPLAAPAGQPAGTTTTN